jgi:xylose dehydrogenase (NAD/NADP)
MDPKEFLADATERDWETDPPENPMQYAVIGLGRFGRSVALPAIEAAEYATASVVVSGSPAKAEDVAAAYDATGLTYEAYHDGDAADEYEAVYIATPNATHLDFAETAADLGKHVLCEKPLEATTDRAAELVDVTAAADVELMTAYRMQTTPLVRRAREMVAHGAIGEPVRAEGSFNTKPLRGDSPDQWRLDDDLGGGGALPDIGIYPLNTTRFILDAEPVSVRGYTASPDAPFEDVDEHVAFTLGFEGGVHATGHASFHAQPESRLRFVGTEGIIDIEPVFHIQAERTLTLQREDAELAVTTSSDEVAAEFDYFAHAIRTGAPIEPDGADGLADMELIEAVYNAAESGREVRL